MRLTARLTQIMAWLLIQKAVHAGELDRSEAARPNLRLGARTLCTTHDELALATLPAALQGLMERSYRLYVRVARLDDMVARDAAAGRDNAPA
jgi:regulator of CtrA degradation